MRDDRRGMNISLRNLLNRIFARRPRGPDSSVSTPDCLWTDADHQPARDGVDNIVDPWQSESCTDRSPDCPISEIAHKIDPAWCPEPQTSSEPEEVRGGESGQRNPPATHQ